MPGRAGMTELENQFGATSNFAEYKVEPSAEPSSEHSVEPLNDAREIYWSYTMSTPDIKLQKGVVVEIKFLDEIKPHEFIEIAIYSTGSRELEQLVGFSIGSLIGPQATYESFIDNAYLSISNVFNGKVVFSESFIRSLFKAIERQSSTETKKIFADLKKSGRRQKIKRIPVVGKLVK